MLQEPSHVRKSNLSICKPNYTNAAWQRLQSKESCLTLAHLIDKRHSGGVVHGESALGGGTNACGLEEEAAGRLQLHAWTAYQCLDGQWLRICLRIGSGIRAWFERHSLLSKVVASCQWSLTIIVTFKSFSAHDELGTCRTSLPPPVVFGMKLLAW